jgi:hypothetical protein
MELQAVGRKRLHPMEDMFEKSVNTAICVIPAKAGCSTNTPQGGTLFSPHAVRGILVNPHALKGTLFSPHAVRGILFNPHAWGTKLSNRFSGVRH